eukprot:TRINITY_DN5176_c0_g3_i1.p1 TRINITY_DN5176_c0_g3~~TRINITY_DN5176_c0_g3_i1.p1  ORF type:complete len:441 (-),score=56.18 TRINITY_DN5176_c0_g3_i1:150-1472(-)
MTFTFYSSLLTLAVSYRSEMLSHDVADADAFPLSVDPDVTASGCTCKSACGATLTVNNSACDWCWTTDRNCGKFSIRGNWDYCVYPKMGSWESQSSEEKESQLWNLITSAESLGKSSPMPSLVTTVTKALSESMITVFDDQWDVLPKGRSKVIHSQGVVCKFDLDVASKSFSGLFGAGKSKGIIRMGSATPSDSSLGIHPGIAVKFLRSGVRSANFVALSAAPTSESYDFFSRKMSNQVAPAKALQMTGKFQQASGCINQVGLSDVCRYSQNGTASVAVFPYEIQFDPADVHFPSSNAKVSPEKLMQQLASIDAGRHIFDVYTYDSPGAKKQGRREKFGTMTTTSKCVQSLFGDGQLFFRHQRMEEDFAVKPEWIPDAISEACQASNKPSSTWQCASPFERGARASHTSGMARGSSRSAGQHGRVRPGHASTGCTGDYTL